MILVFGAFILGGERVIMLFGLGLAGAVLLDALVIRMALVPGLMLLVGKANWWLPGWLDRVLPHLNVEGDVHDGPQPARRSEPTATCRSASPRPPTAPETHPLTYHRPKGRRQRMSDYTIANLKELDDSAGDHASTSRRASAAAISTPSISA